MRLLNVGASGWLPGYVRCSSGTWKSAETSRASPTIRSAALRERGAFVEGVDEGEAIRGVEQDALQIDVELAHHVRHEVSLDGDDRRVRHPVHVVPKALAGELPRLDVHQSA